MEVLKTESSFYLIFEYCAGGDLQQYIKSHQKLPEKQTRDFMRQIANGLKYLQRQKIIHRDLKPSNFLISDKTANPIIKIADFGFAKMKQKESEEELFQTQCGTPIYMAPEILLGSNYSEKADLWSLGIILFEMLVGKPPFMGLNYRELMSKIKKGIYIIPSDINISKRCSDLLIKLLLSDPTKRLNWEQFFNHPFIKNEVDDDSSSGKRLEFSSDEERKN